MDSLVHSNVLLYGGSVALSAVMGMFLPVLCRTHRERRELLNLQLLRDRRQDERTEHRVSATGRSRTGQCSAQPLSRYSD